MQACKNTYDKETNKVANELNKLGFWQEKQNITRKGNTPHKRDSFEDVRERGSVRGERGEGAFRNEKEKMKKMKIKVAVGFIKN